MKSILVSLSHNQVTLKGEESVKEGWYLSNASSSGRADLNSIRVIRELDITAIPRGSHSVHIKMPNEIHKISWLDGYA
jgi:hypothetical protein